MPIGKNALKRVNNNGYSSVKTSAPDMENSEIVEVDTPVAEAKTEPKKAEKPKKAAEAKTEPKKAEKTEKAASAKAAPKKNNAPKAEKPKIAKPKIEKVSESSHPDGFVKISFGMDMPTYIL
jgi:hypothetical protein